MATDIRLGIDVGGTFTDVVALGAGTRVRGKVPSTPADPAEAVVAACTLVARELGTDLPGLLGRLSRFGLGTTVVTNVLATHAGRRLGLVTTSGFEDLVPLARGSRVADGGWLVTPPLLVDRARIAGVDERTDRTGTILTAIDPGAAATAVDRLLERGAEAIVVSFLWSFRNPANELAVRDEIARRRPDVPVVLGSELAPVIREYERTQFALLNAYTGGALDWLGPLAEKLRADGLACPIVLMHSTGGATTVDGAQQVPIGLAQSGPAAGAAAATRLARAMGEPDVVTCDLGGTSLDVALISAGEALRRTRGAILGHWTAMSMVDVDSVGSGGGSIAWVDPVGAIRVGPRSAGADPGPASYGRGGTEPTLTDALVVLGYLDPARFLDGRMPLDADRALAACAALGTQVGLDAHQAAWGIREVALASMVRAVRNRIASRGLVAAELSLLAYGGCGGLFAAGIARDVGCRRAVVPELAAELCAFGAATAAVHRERLQSVAVRLPGDPQALRATLLELERAVLADLAGDGVEPAGCTIGFEADVRFERQGAELTIPLPPSARDDLDLDALAGAFRDEYVRRFGAGAVALGVAVEVMTLRAVGEAVAEPDDVSPPDSGSGAAPSAAGAQSGRPQFRAVQLDREGPPESVPVVVRAELPAGAVVRGPAVVDAGDTTVWIGRGDVGAMDALGSLTVELVEESR